MALLPPELVTYYELGDLFFGDFVSGARWVIRSGLEWFAGPLLADMFDAAADRALVVTEVQEPAWA